MQHSFTLATLDDTLDLAKRIAKVLISQFELSKESGFTKLPGFVITLDGSLGAGKTTLVRGIINSLGIKGTVKSPTFTLVESYRVKLENIPFRTNKSQDYDIELEIYHFDLYRFSDPEEWFMAGFHEYFEGNSICLIEWASRANELIPQIDWNFELCLNKSEGITCTINTKSPNGVKCLVDLLATK